MSPEDVYRKSPNADLAGSVAFPGDVLEVNGEYEHGGGKGYRSVVEMPFLNQDTFTVAFQFWPRDFDLAPNFDGPSWWLRERLFHFGIISKSPSFSGHETILMGGKSYRWLGYKVLNGELCLTLNNNQFSHPFRSVSVATDRWHTLVASIDRKSGRVATVFDGIRLQDYVLPEGFQWNNIADRTAPEERQFTLTDYSDGTCFHGYAARMRVLNRALDTAELERFSAAMGREVPAYIPPIRGTGRTWLPVLIGFLGILVLIPVVFRLVAAARRRSVVSQGTR